MLLRSLMLSILFCLAPATTANAQQISAPGWNQEEAKAGELLFKHISGKASVRVLVSNVLPDDVIEDFLQTQLTDLDEAGKCPGGQNGSIRRIMNDTTWQAKSYNEAAHCTFLARRIDAQKMYFISAYDTSEDWIATERFSYELMRGLAGDTKREEDLKRAEAAAALDRNPPVIRPTTIAKSDKIIAVFYDNTRQQTNWTPGLSGMMQHTNYFSDTEMLFADGTACKDCMEDWTNDPSLKRYRKENSDSIGKWARLPSGFSIQYPDGEPAIVKLHKDNVKPIAAGKRFNNYTLESVNGSADGAGFSYTQRVRTDTIFLGADGKFSWGYDGTAVRANMGGGYDATKGEYVGADYPGAGPTESGRYSVSDYGIKLEYTNGNTEVLSLLTFPESPDFLIIDGLAFIPKKPE